VTRAAAVAGRVAAGGLAAVSAALAGASWPVLAVIATAAVLVLAAVCWAIADNGRARRLALLIRACRGDSAEGRR
jgi:hypothetical protein